MDLSNGGAGDVADTRAPDGEAMEFVRFCHRRKRVGWPELYDEMCAVAGRGLYHGLGPEELASIGIGFGLFQMPSLAVLVNRVVAEDAEHRRRIAETVRAAAAVVAVPVSRVAADADRNDAPVEQQTPDIRTTPEPAERAPEHGSIRIAVAAGA
jgi:hypothetical protein